MAGKDSPVLPVDSSTFFKLVRIVNLTARPFQESVGKQHHLTLNEWRAMVVLASHPGVAAKEVADLTGLDKMSVSRAVAGLERRGRVARKADANDQRRTHLFLSVEGRRLFAAIGKQAKVRESELLAGASASELERLNATLDKLLANLSRRA